MNSLILRSCCLTYMPYPGTHGDDASTIYYYRIMLSTGHFLTHQNSGTNVDDCLVFQPTNHWTIEADNLYSIDILLFSGLKLEVHYMLLPVGKE